MGVQDENGKQVRGRKYPWGTVNIEDKNHCDFLALRSLVLAHHMQDLKDVTSQVHYEKYRCTKLTALAQANETHQAHPTLLMLLDQVPIKNNDYTVHKYSTESTSTGGTSSSHPQKKQLHPNRN